MAERPAKGNVPAVRPSRTIGNQQMAAVYHVPALHPATLGPWSKEADKLTWVDPETGLHCIIRRSALGFLSGYVAVPRRHPLFGFRADAVSTTVAMAHGGLNYAAPCDATGPEETSICHVEDMDAIDGSTDEWWFGFSCDQVTDLIPDDGAHAAKAQQAGLEQEYRDERYLFGQCTSLAAQLAAADPMYSAQANAPAGSSRTERRR